MNKRYRWVVHRFLFTLTHSLSLILSIMGSHGQGNQKANGDNGWQKTTLWQVTKSINVCCLHFFVTILANCIRLHYFFFHTLQTRTWWPHTTTKLGKNEDYAFYSSSWVSGNKIKQPKAWFSLATQVQAELVWDMQSQKDIHVTQHFQMLCHFYMQNIY